MKYLGCYFYERTCGIDFSYGFRKFYGNFNNVMSVVGYYSNEMATLHLIKSYCVPSVLYVSAVSLPLSPASTRCFFLLLYLSNPFVYIHLLFTVLLCWLINLIDLI